MARTGMIWVHLSVPDLITVAGRRGRHLIRARPTLGAWEWGEVFPPIFGVLFCQEEDEWVPDSERKISTTSSFYNFPN